MLTPQACAGECCPAREVLVGTMPRFYFHVHDGTPVPDAEGVELADTPAACAEAIRCSGEIIRDFPRSVSQRLDWRMIVTNDADLPIYTLRFSATAHQT